MILLNANGATYTFYVLLFAVFSIILLWGFNMLYKAYQTQDDDALRRAKFVLMFSVIAIVCIAIVSFAITGKLPVN